MGKNRLPREEPDPRDKPEDVTPLENCLRGPDGSNGYQPPPDLPPKRQYCLLCDAEILGRADGLNLADVENVRVFHLHHRCLDKLPDVEKIRIKLLFRQGEVGADLTRVVGEVREAIRAFHSLVSMAMREYEHREPDGEGGGNN